MAKKPESVEHQVPAGSSLADAEAKPTRRLFSSSLTPLYPQETDQYLRDVPAVDAFAIAAELAKKVPQATLDMLDGTMEAIRHIETSRQRFAFSATIARQLVELHPEAVDRLDKQAQWFIRELAARSMSNPPITETPDVKTT